jgi:hypothetical protein
VIAALATAASVFAASSTSYCPGSSGAYMAHKHRHVYFGAAASNRHPFGTRIRLLGTSFLGRKTFTIEDRIGSGSDLDLWAPTCSASNAWGRRWIRYRVLGRKR